MIDKLKLLLTNYKFWAVVIIAALILYLILDTPNFRFEFEAELDKLRK